MLIGVNGDIIIYNYIYIYICIPLVVLGVYPIHGSTIWFQWFTSSTWYYIYIYTWYIGINKDSWGWIGVNGGVYVG